MDDAFVSLVEFENGALGTLEATRFAAGRKNYEVLEINGENGSMRFNMERMNELEVYWADEEPQETRGFHTVSVTETNHPYMKNWWPQGHIIGWGIRSSTSSTISSTPSSTTSRSIPTARPSRTAIAPP